MGDCRDDLPKDYAILAFIYVAGILGGRTSCS